MLCGGSAKLLLSSSPEQATNRAVFLAQHYNSLFLGWLCRGVTPVQVHKGVYFFHPRVIAIPIASCITSTSFIFLPALSNSLHNLSSQRREIKHAESFALVYLCSETPRSLSRHLGQPQQQHPLPG